MIVSSLIWLMNFLAVEVPPNNVGRIDALTADILVLITFAEFGFIEEAYRHGLSVSKFEFTIMVAVQS